MRAMTWLLSEVALKLEPKKFKLQMGKVPLQFTSPTGSRVESPPWRCKNGADFHKGFASYFPGAGCQFRRSVIGERVASSVSTLIKKRPSGATSYC